MEPVMGQNSLMNPCSAASTSRVVRLTALALERIEDRLQMITNREAA